MTDEILIDRVADCFVGDQYVDSNVIEKPEAVVHQETYTQVEKSSPKTCKSNENPSTVDKPGNISQNHLIQRSTDADGFIGVDRRRKRIKNFFLSGIHESVKENQILSYLEQRKITPTHISLFRSHRSKPVNTGVGMILTFVLAAGFPFQLRKIGIEQNILLHCKRIIPG
jgi:hypothetical protein